jgi:hypothetical protein
MLHRLPGGRPVCLPPARDGEPGLRNAGVLGRSSWLPVAMPQPGRLAADRRLETE